MNVTNQLSKLNIAENFDAATQNYDSIAYVQREIGYQLFEYVKKFFLMTKHCNTAMSSNIKLALDIGTGTGFMPELLYKLFPSAKYLLNDISLQMLRLAANKLSARGAKVFTVHGDAESTVFQKVDLVISNLALQWFNDIARLLNSISKNTKIMAFSTLLNTSFSDWRMLHEKFGLRCNQHFYPRYDEMVSYCLKTLPKSYFVTKKTYNVANMTSMLLAKHFKEIGANTPKFTKERGLLYKILRHKESIVVNYDVFFGILLYDDAS